MNPDLAKERENTTFNPVDLTYILEKGKHNVEKRKRIENLVWNDKEIQDGPVSSFMNQEESYEEGIRKLVLSIRRIQQHGFTDPEEKHYFRSRMFPNETMPGGLHEGMFLPAMRQLAHDDMKKKWLKRAMNYEIIGTYAQTELGHGTFLRGLETTATYNKNTEEFIIHSPTLTSAKWWPGGLGKTSNFAIVMATLLIDGKSYGMQGFLVQLRDLNTHRPLKGITLGDIGPKVGNIMNDNGFMRFDHVRIPRENMLARNAEVQRDGTFVQKNKNQKLNYGTMIMVRAHIVLGNGGKALAQAVTIATRYCCVRRQSEMKPGSPEPQVIDYQTVQNRIFQHLATAYAFIFTGNRIVDFFETANKNILEGDLELLPELHALAAGLKAYTTDIAGPGIEELRMTCGGHGYSLASGFTKIYVNAIAGCTYEGENNVMYLQTARYLAKSYNNAQREVKMSGSLAYLTENSSNVCNITAELDLDSIVHAFHHRAKGQITHSVTRYNRLIAAGKPQHVAWNMTSVLLKYAAETHLEAYTVCVFVDKVRSAELNEPIGRILTILCRFYALNLICKSAGDFIQDGFMNREQLEMIEDKKLELLIPIRKDAIALTDAFDFHDKYLQSVLGKYDGNVYENLYEWAKSSPLNKTEVHDSYYKYLQPLQQEMAQSKL